MTHDYRGDFPGGQPARDKFLWIIDEEKIIAYRTHCRQFRQPAEELPDKSTDDGEDEAGKEFE